MGGRGACSVPILCLLACSLLSFTLVESQSTQTLLYEEIFLSVPDLDSAKQHLRTLTSEPHIAGSVYDYRTALYVRDKFISYGLETEMIPIESKLVYPKERHVKMIHPITWTASLKEDPYPFIDPQTDSANVVNTYNAYSADGTVHSHVIYVNYGRLEDYQYLIEQDISVQGAIVLIRYGQISRMSKVLLAQVQGAAGVLLYSDPAEAGWIKGTVYPEGPWGPMSRVEMGSVVYANICPGNPVYSRMLIDGPCISESTPVESLLPEIPVQPISWGDAYPILAQLSGPVAPIAWQGGVNVTYHIGNTFTPIVELSVHSNWTTATTWNVVGTMKGALEPQHEILLGNHRDSWKFGAVDPSSGTAVLLEVARAFSQLMNTTRWRPTRTIKFLSWDAEEFAFIGSTQYAEENYENLRENAIAYLNVDIAASGPKLLARASPSFHTFVVNATKRVNLPDDSGTVYSAWDRDIQAFGSGSDYVAFLEHVGIASIDISFISSEYNGVYHSLYDSYYWLDRLSGGMPYLKTCAQLYGLLALRLASDTLLPFNYTDYAVKLTEYANMMSRMIKEYGGEEEMNTHALMEAIAEFNSTTSFLEKERKKLESMIAKAGNAPLSVNLQNAISHHNERAHLGERNFTTEAGLHTQGRPWFKHLIQGPAMYDGYNPDPLPGFAQAVRDQNWPMALNEMHRIIECINAASVFLRDAPPIIDEYAGPIMAMRIASVVWGCMAFFLILGLVAFFIWRYIKNKRIIADATARAEYEGMFAEFEEATPLTKV